jgi:hypothetical protein
MTSCTRVCQICGRIAEASQQNNSEVTTTAWNDHTAERRSKLGHVLVDDTYLRGIAGPNDLITDRW